MSMRFLVIGDVFGRGGRQTVTQALPELRQEFQPDSVIINIENMAHGFGVSPSPWVEVVRWGADVYTTGDHAWDQTTGLALLEDNPHLIRPANYPAGVPGRGFYCYQVRDVTVAVMNLQGQVFMRNHPLNPFLALDELLELPEIKNAPIKLLDFHAEATSEKRALGWYADGRISAVWGTHTHVPTNDGQILPQGSGYITDVGMTGSLHSIIGAEPKPQIKAFKSQIQTTPVPAVTSPFELNAVLFDINPKTSQTENIAQIRKIINDR